MEHTFLFKPGLWTGRGILMDPGGAEQPVECRVDIRHGSGGWLVETETAKQGGGTLSISVIKARPPGETARSMTWESEDPEMGSLKGKFMVAGDSIVSSCETEAAGGDNYSGLEFFIRAGDDLYMNRGARFKSGKMTACWIHELKFAG